MRRCTRNTCGVILLDSDIECPVCGAETVDAGSGKKEKPVHNEVRIVYRQRHGSRIMALLTLIVGGAVIYLAYLKISGGDVQSGAGNGLAEWFFKLLKK